MKPRISFGMIVLNGEPFTRYNLRSIYPYAHQIVVVHGAVPAYAHAARSDGSARDGTLEVLQRFISEEDPEGKIELVRTEGFWEEKHAMSQAYAHRATGDYLWQVDVDEFYHPDDIETVLTLLAHAPTITGMSFKMRTFWGGFDYTCDSWYLRQGKDVYHRLFKWGQGYRYAAHRPPTVLDAQGRDVRDGHYLHGEELAQQYGLMMYHYSLVFPTQVREKAQYYDQAAWNKNDGMRQWAERSYFSLDRPFRPHNVYRFPGWVERFEGQHPPQIAALRRAVDSRQVVIEQRPTDDIERLLQSPRYRLGRALLKLSFRPYRVLQYLRWGFGKVVEKLTP